MLLENLTAIIPYRNGQDTIQRLLETLPGDLPILVVDDQSADPFQTSQANVRVLRLKERGYFAGACNAGIAACETDVLILNQDVWLEGTQWQDLLAYRSAYAIGGDKVARHRAFPMGYVQGTFMWLRRDAIAALGTPLDRQHYPLWGGTALAQVRLSRMGYKALPMPMAEYGLRHARGDAPYGSAIKAALETESEKQGLLLRTPPAISVIITCYNYAKFLPDAVASLIGGATEFGDLPPQTFQSFEVVIVDDASTDNTAEVGERLADPWKLIHFYRAPQNLGSAAAANFGIQKSHGKYLTVLDADDMMQETRLETLYHTLLRNPHHLVYDDCMEVATDRQTLLHARPQNADGIKQWQNLYTIPLRLPDYDFDNLLQRNGIHKGILIEKRAWEEVGGYPEEFKNGREDWAFNIALGQAGYCGVHVQQPLYLRRQHGGNRHLRNTNPYWRERFQKQLRDRYAELYAGGRPTMCCGNKSTSKSNGGSAGAQTLKAGRYSMAATADQAPSNMVLIEYQLQKSGTKTFVGGVSRRTYVFGGQRKQGYVDARDADGLLSLIENHQVVFKRAAPAPTAPPPAKVAVTEAVGELLQQSDARVAAWETAPAPPIAVAENLPPPPPAPKPQAPADVPDGPKTAKPTAAKKASAKKKE